MGITDFGDGPRGYSAIDLVMAARDCRQAEATSWLRAQLGLDDGPQIVIDLKPRMVPEPVVGIPTTAAATPVDELPDALTRVPGLLGDLVDWSSDPLFPYAREERLLWSSLRRHVAWWPLGKSGEARGAHHADGSALFHSLAGGFAMSVQRAGVQAAFVHWFGISRGQALVLDCLYRLDAPISVEVLADQTTCVAATIERSHLPILRQSLCDGALDHVRGRGYVLTAAGRQECSAALRTMAAEMEAAA